MSDELAHTCSGPEDPDAAVVIITREDLTCRACWASVPDPRQPVIPTVATSGHAVLVGDVLHGSAAVSFGRDSYECKRVEATGADWVIARTVDEGRPNFATGPTILRDLARYRTDFTYCDHNP